jgi:hypothetical protein
MMRAMGLLRRAAFMLLLSLLPAAASAQTFRTEIVNGGELASSDPIALSTVLILIGENDVEACTGSLIAPHWVITAAHCATRDSAAMTGTVDPGDVRIVFGNTRLRSGFPGGTRPTRRPDRVRIHPLFAGHSGIYGPQRHDLALLHFRDGIPSGFTPARFLGEADALLSVGSSVTIAGYGTDRARRSTANFVLRSFDTIVSLLRADSSVVEMRPPADHRGGACQGDSGGPAFLRDPSGIILWGVASAATSDCSTMAQYEDLRRHRAWLKTELGPDYGAPAVSTRTAPSIGSLSNVLEESLVQIGLTSARVNLQSAVCPTGTQRPRLPSR